VRYNILASIYNVKHCGSCGEDKAATKEFFHKSNQTLGGFQAWCKECRNAKKRLYRAKNKDIEFKKCWALSNLQPLEASMNCSKQNKLDENYGSIMEAIEKELT